MNKYNVENGIVSRDLCVSCSSCTTVCAANAISIVFKEGLFVPCVDAAKCTGCGQCMRICPSFQVDLQHWSRKTLLEGEEIASYTAYSKDDDIRKRGASGGIVTQLLVSLLRQRVYDKATYVHYPRHSTENRAVVQITDDIEIIKKGAKSKYLPVSIEGLLNYMSDHPKERIIITSTPCQLIAIKHYIKVKHLCKDNYLFIGLFCEMTMNYNFMNYIAWKYGEYDALQYKTKTFGGWPGNMAIIRKGQMQCISRDIRMALKPYFQLSRCRVCFDKLNRNADISCGDCYVAGEESVEGKSSVVIRTPKGEKAWSLCQNEIVSKPSSLVQISTSQAVDQTEICANRAKSIAQLYCNAPEFLGVTEGSDTLQQRRLGKAAYQDSGCRSLDEALYVVKKNKYIRLLQRLWYRFRPKPQKFLLIDHAGFINKGAELMLRETVIQLRTLFPEYVLSIPHYEYVNNVAYCVKNGILPKYPHKKGMRGWLQYMLANRLRKKRRYVDSADISLIFDIGGFQFSDQWWYEGYSKSWRDYYHQFTHPDLRLFFFPQAFGPFALPETAEVMRFVYEKAAVIFAREQTSYEYLRQVLPTMDKVRLTSDFTCLLKPNIPLYSLIPDKQYVTIIPNMRMLDKQDVDSAHAYMEFMCTLVKELCSSGEHVFLLNHEGLDDEKLGFQIKERVGIHIPVLTGLSALDVKAVIGKSKLVVSSRFHGVVSGLSQGIPTFCTGWSFKYKELLNDYHVPTNFLDYNQINDSVAKVLDALEKPQVYTPTDKIILQKELESIVMWGEISSIVNAGKGSQK